MKNLEENFQYDSQNRLTGVWLGPMLIIWKEFTINTTNHFLI